MTLKKGQLLGPYEIEAPAGKGGMGEVYRAKDTRLDRTVAIKVLPSHSTLNSDTRARFEREARTISGLNHPNICTLHDVGHQDGVDYLVMEYLEGVTLATRLKSGPLPIPEFLNYAVQIADALATAHRQGVVHRDLKPSNIMLTKSGAKVLDFGLARRIPTVDESQLKSSDTRTSPITRDGTIVGTVQYMSPEQLEGKTVDYRSDLFAFGAVLYEMATGEKAFQGKNEASLIAAILKDEPRTMLVSGQSVTPLLDHAVRFCIAKNPDQRWQSADDLKSILLWVKDSDSQEGAPALRQARKKTGERVFAGVGAIFVVFAAILSFFYIKASNKPADLIVSDILAPEGTEFSNWIEGACVLSPDGKMLVFSACDTMSSEPKFWVRSLNSSQAFPLPNTERAYLPFWSPDSRYIAFFIGNKLNKMLATGGPAITICDVQYGRGGSWGKDNVILFSPDHEDVIYQVSAEGGMPYPVTSLDSVHKDRSHRYVHFLPDGEKFLFLAKSRSSAEGEQGGVICLASLSSDETTRLTSANSNALYADQHILFVQKGILMAQRFDASKGTLLGDALPIARDVSWIPHPSYGCFSVSSEGSLVYRKGAVQLASQMLVVDTSGQALDTIGEHLYQKSPRLSPDGTKLALVISDPITANHDVWIYDLKTRTRARFTFADAIDRNPIWSPDGSEIAFTREVEAGNAIYVRKANGIDSARQLYFTPHRIWSEGWSKDGTFLLVVIRSPEGAEDIWRIPLTENREPRPYLITPFIESFACLSPDERWIAYASNETGSDEVYVGTFPESTNRWRISKDGGNRISWSRDGSHLYYIDLKGVLVKASVDGSSSKFRIRQVEPLFEPGFNSNGLPFDTFADNVKFIIDVSLRNDQRRSAVLVQNWPNMLEMQIP